MSFSGVFERMTYRQPPNSTVFSDDCQFDRDVLFLSCAIAAKAIKKAVRGLALDGRQKINVSRELRGGMGGS
jgi:hypothetical protein